jgi:ketosteroid isomerase-like protein
VDDAIAPTAEQLAALVDHRAVSQLQSGYADAVTSRDWAAMRALFVPDVVVTLDLGDRPAMEVVGAEELVAFVSGAVERFPFFEFVILNAHTELWPGGDRGAATARIFLCELRQGGDDQARTQAFGRYTDRYVRVDDGTWRIARRAYRSMARWPAGDTFPLEG